MKINDFKLERYFAEHEFTAKYLLSSSDCDGYSMKYVLDQASAEEMELWNTIGLGYTESLGNPLLRDAILKHYRGDCNVDNVLVGSPGELAFILMNVLLDSESHAVVMSPSYQSLYEVARSVGSDLSFWLPEDDTWIYSVDTLKALIKNNTKLIVINFPHNPTGAMISENELMEIVELARENGCYIYSDEMYRELTLTACVALPPISDIYEKGISLWGMAKTFGLAGLRIGWIVSADVDLLRKIASYKDFLSICSSAPSEVLSIIALNHSDKFIQPNIEKIKRNINLFETYMESGQTLFKQFVSPRAGTVSFVPINTNESAKEFSDKLVEKTGIMTVPSEMFDYDGRYLRIGFGRENFWEVIEFLKRGL